jgi:phage-related minor tail protein
MAGKGSIRGITIEIGADTSKFQNELAKLNTRVKSTKTQLSDVNRLLKFSPKNTELLNQKFRILKNEIYATRDKLKELKQTEADWKAKGVNQWSDEFMALRREIIQTESQLESLEKQAKQFGSVGAQKIALVGEAVKEFGAKAMEAGKTMSKYVTAPIIGLGIAAVKTDADFEQAMSNVAATMGYTVDELNDDTSEASQNMQQLSDFARQMGSTTKFSAKEAADALNYMALAGYDTETSMKMLPNVLNLAAAGSFDLARASDMVTDTQTAFGISLDRTQQMVDEMAKAASTGNTSVEQLGEAFLTVGGLAKELNGGVLELTGGEVHLADGATASVDGIQELEIALTGMANAGIKGSEAGTHMRNMLMKLASPTSDGTKALKDLGVEVFDAEDKMKSLSVIFTDLSKAMDGLTQEEKINAISDLFNARDLASAEALLEAVSSDWDEIGVAILGAEGAAQNMADTQLNNLNGQLTILKSALQEAAISIGTELMPYIRKAAEYIQGLVDKFNKLSPSTKKIILIIAGVVAAIGPLITIIGALAFSIGSIMAIAPLIAGAFVPFTIAAAGIIAAVILVIKHWDWIKATAIKLWETMKVTFTNMKNSIVNAWNSVKTATANAWNAVKAKVTGTWANLKTAIPNAVEALRTSIANAWDNIKAKAESVWTAVRTAVATAIDGAKQKVSNTVSTIKSTLSSAFNSIKSTATNVWNGIKNAIVSPIETAKNTLSGIVDTIKGIFNGIKDAINWPRIETKQKTFFGKTVEWPEIVWNARAMQNPVVLDGATIFGAMNGKLYGGGERGKEVLMSYDKLAQMMGGGGTTNISIVVNPSQGMNERDLANLVAVRLQQMVNKKGAVWAT